MVPVYIIAVLGGIGYYLTTEESNRINTKKYRKNKRKIFREEEARYDMPNGETIYEQDFTNHVRNFEHNLAKDRLSKGEPIWPCPVEFVH